MAQIPQQSLAQSCHRAAYSAHVFAYTGLFTLLRQFSKFKCLQTICMAQIPQQSLPIINGPVTCGKNVYWNSIK